MTHVVVAVQVEQAASPCTCDFSVPKVRWYLHIWRQSRIYREPFADVMRSEARESRQNAVWNRGARAAQHRGLMIGLALESARDQAGLQLAPWNADAISRFLCECGR